MPVTAISADSSRTTSLRFSWPTTPSSVVENVFFGVWHPTSDITVQLGKAPAGVRPSLARGRRWLLLANGSPLHKDDRSLIHGCQGSRHHVAFRGYIVEPSLHSYSASRSIVSYWAAARSQRHNGVFSTVVVDDNAGTITLLTDALGFGPLYYRTWNGALLFSTNPRFLAITDDSPDYLAWRCWIQSGFIPSDRTLTADVRRVPAGTAVHGRRTGYSERKWFDFDSLPDGKRSIGNSAYREVEECFQDAMSKCLAVDNGRIVLPLSSGHDSRRFLASFVGRGVQFDALTARIRHEPKGCRDLDATFAAAMAADFGFPHSIAELDEARDFVISDIDRRILTDTESETHTWVLSLVRALPDQPGVVFDGVVGDILGNPGFRMSEMYESTARDLDLIVNECVSDNYESVLRSPNWPTAAEVRSEIRKYLLPFMHRFNMAEFAFILLRQRRNTSLWSQQLLPAGHVVVCPYLDLDYLSLLLDFCPKEKHTAIFQRQCLERFWPAFAKYPGTRDIPRDMPAEDPRVLSKRDLACFRFLCHEIARHGHFNQVTRLLTFRRRLLLSLTRHGVDRLYSRTWGVHRVLELQAREATRLPCWT